MVRNIIKELYETVADVKRDIEDKVAEQTDKITQEYYKCNFEKLAMQVAKRQLKKEMEKMEDLFNMHSVKLEELIQGADRSATGLASLKRVIDFAGKHQPPRGETSPAHLLFRHFCQKQQKVHPSIEAKMCHQPITNLSHMQHKHLLCLLAQILLWQSR
jgi:hypothetical protein